VFATLILVQIDFEVKFISILTFLFKSKSVENFSVRILIQYKLYLKLFQLNFGYNRFRKIWDPTCNLCKRISL